MARGWESKSVEDQQAERMWPPEEAKPHLTAEERARQQRRSGLLLSRNRILQQIEKAGDLRYRALLEQTLSALDSQLAKL